MYTIISYKRSPQQEDIIDIIAVVACNAETKDGKGAKGTSSNPQAKLLKPNKGTVARTTENGSQKFNPAIYIPQFVPLSSTENTPFFCAQVHTLLSNEQKEIVQFLSPALDKVVL